MTFYTAFNEQTVGRSGGAAPTSGFGLLGLESAYQRNVPLGGDVSDDTKEEQGNQFVELVAARAISLGGFPTESSAKPYHTHFGNTGYRLADVALRHWPPQVRDLEQLKKNAAAIALLERWLNEDRSEGNLEANEWERFKESIDRDRSSVRKLFP
jgi:hypothetical protein